MAVAAWAAAAVLFHAALAAVVLGIPALAHFMARQSERDSGSGAAAPEVARVVDLWFEAGDLVRPFGLAVAMAGVAVGVALLVAATTVLQGRGLRFARVALATAAAQAFLAAAWLTALALTTLGDWNVRHESALDELRRESPGGGPLAPGFIESGPAAVRVFVALALLATAVSLGLFRLLGRPAVRDWCAGRSARPAVATVAGPT
jgi:hypothetical protein